MSTAQVRHFRCYTCGHHYQVTGWSGTLASLRQIVLRCAATVHSGNAAHNSRGTWTATVPDGVECGAVLGWSSAAYPSTDPRRNYGVALTIVPWQELTRTTIAPRTLVEEVAALRSEVAALRAAADTDLAAEVTRLRDLHETPCKGLVPSWAGPEQGVEPCGGYLGHPGGCAPFWPAQSGWRTA